MGSVGATSLVLLEGSCRIGACGGVVGRKPKKALESFRGTVGRSDLADLPVAGVPVFQVTDVRNDMI